jgi:hypothetical protein
MYLAFTAVFYVMNLIEYYNHLILGGILFTIYGI